MVGLEIIRKEGIVRSALMEWSGEILVFQVAFK